MLLKNGDVLITEYGKYEVIFDESYRKLGILIPSKKELAIRHSALEYALNEFKEIQVVTKEMMKSISYKGK